MDTDRKVVSKVRTTWQQYYPKNQCENSGKNLEDSNQYEIILNIFKKRKIIYYWSKMKKCASKLLNNCSHKTYSMVAFYMHGIKSTINFGQ